MQYRFRSLQFFSYIIDHNTGRLCKSLVNYDLNWNPMVLEQRIGRIDMIGQEKPIINIYNFVTEGSIDERIVETLGAAVPLQSNAHQLADPQLDLLNLWL
jgi:hypothetical protein